MGNSRSRSRSRRSRSRRSISSSSSSSRCRCFCCCCCWPCTTQNSQRLTPLAPRPGKKPWVDHWRRVGKSGSGGPLVKVKVRAQIYCTVHYATLRLYSLCSLYSLVLQFPSTFCPLQKFRDTSVPNLSPTNNSQQPTQSSPPTISNTSFD